MTTQNSATPAAALQARLARHRTQAQRLLEAAQAAMQRGRWTQSEELLWGSLTAAVKGVALWHGAPADAATDAARRDFLHRLGQQQRDRYIRDAFDHLSAFANAAEQVRERRRRVDYLFLAMDDLTEAIHRLLALIPAADSPAADSPADSTTPANPAPSPRPPGRRRRR